ncbi:TlpA disulfide reductase family protein [uncultured Dokdonia sp.]|uniref:TlpA family protein disulfide reductase n=1 Tax=uncultured Dokdonia sp. TaxID=575653 RepID=UPI00261811EF|nr:TlpA disulfide reductase family protein [uncultured Dokdonia sp.]
MKKINLKNILFIIVIALLLIPQTRTPIQVAFNKIKVKLFSPSAFAKADQTQLQPFTYQLASIDGLSRDAEVGQGKVTFISYWATWCPPCIAELPSIEKLYADYGNKIDFVLITQEEPTVVKRFLERKKLNIPAVFPKMQTPELLFERSIPTNYIIDKTGKIIIKEKGAANWNSAEVRETLDRLISETTL